MSAEPALESLKGAAAPPRRNGELVFEKPWEGRAFGVGVALAREGVYTWDEFRACLVEELGRRDGEDYYDAWLASVERLLSERGVLPENAVQRRAAELSHGDEHAHDHEH